MFIIPTQTAFHVIIIAIIFKNKFYATACIRLGMHGMAKYVYSFIITISKSLRFKFQRCDTGECNWELK